MEITKDQKGNDANRRYKKVILQMCCDSCYEILAQENHKVECDRLGVPLQERLEAMFGKQTFTKHNQCPVCQSKQITRYIGYAPDICEENYDLPF